MWADFSVGPPVPAGGWISESTRRIDKSRERQRSRRRYWPLKTKGPSVYFLESLRGASAPLLAGFSPRSDNPGLARTRGHKNAAAEIPETTGTMVNRATPPSLTALPAGVALRVGIPSVSL